MEELRNSRTHLPKEKVHKVDGVNYSNVERNSPKSLNLRVYLLDNEFKTLTYDHSTRAVDLIDQMSKKMSITNSENFGIFDVYTHNSRVEEKLLKDDDCISDVIKKHKKDRKIVFKCKMFRELNIINADEFSTHLYYIQTKENIISGYFNAPLHIAITLAAIEMQIEFGPFNPEKHKPGFIFPRIRDFFSERLLEQHGSKYIEKRLLDEYKQGEPKALLFLKKTYTLEAMKLSVFGCRFFNARQRRSRDIPERIQLGVKSIGIIIISQETREFLRQWSFETIFRWGYTSDAFYFQLRSLNDGISGTIWELFTNEGETVSDLLNMYQKYILDDIDELHCNQIYMSSDLAIIKIQSCWRGYRLRKKLGSIKKLLAAQMIVKIWRDFRNNKSLL
ncbi:TLN1 [Blepharisma stoltei]|uniref:FERM domain-containing protein n=1 Tax=Blepharisma stoltei TaxID=1481888 RepID=A0AAU9IJI5_9CILI|nr:unnamed protein product [Blepharisma stoltei]